MLKFIRNFLAKITAPKPPSHENQPASPVSVSYDETSVFLSFEKQTIQALTWSEITFIEIRIEDDFLPFPYWYLGNKENIMRIPNNATGASELFFDGFTKHIRGYASDKTFKTIIDASGAIEGVFPVWHSGSL